LRLLFKGMRPFVRALSTNQLICLTHVVINFSMERERQELRNFQAKTALKPFASSLDRSCSIAVGKTHLFHESIRPRFECSKFISFEDSFRKAFGDLKKHSAVGTSLGLSPDTLASYQGFSVPVSAGTKGIDTIYQPLSQDAFYLISDWCHFAILELLSIRGFDQRDAHIAASLGISLIEVRDALSRLERLAFIRKSARGKWELLSQHNTTTNFTGTSAALKQLQRQMLTKALEALDDIPPKYETRVP